MKTEAEIREKLKELTALSKKRSDIHTGSRLEAIAALEWVVKK